MVIYSWLLFAHPGLFLLIALATSSIRYAIFRSGVRFRERKRDYVLPSNGDPDASITSILFARRVMILLFFAVVVILLIIIRILHVLSLLYYCATAVAAAISFVATADLLAPLVHTWFDQFPRLEKIGHMKVNLAWGRSWFGDDISIPQILALVFSAIFAILWVCYYMPLLQNFFVVAIIVFCITKRIPASIKIISYALVAFLILDILWICVSQYIFVDALATFVQTLKALPVMFFMPDRCARPSMEDPLNAFPQVIFRLYEYTNAFVYGHWNVNTLFLGIWHVLLPGTLMNLLYWHDISKEIPTWRGYYMTSHLGYVLGLLLTFVLQVAIKRPYPMSLCLFPMAFLPPVWLAWYRSELVQMWSESLESNADDDLFHLVFDAGHTVYDQAESSLSQLHSQSDEEQDDIVNPTQSVDS